MSPRKVWLFGLRGQLWLVEKNGLTLPRLISRFNCTYKHLRHPNGGRLPKCHRTLPSLCRRFVCYCKYAGLDTVDCIHSIPRVNSRANGQHLEHVVDSVWINGNTQYWRRFDSVAIYRCHCSEVGLGGGDTNLVFQIHVVLSFLWEYHVCLKVYLLIMTKSCFFQMWWSWYFCGLIQYWPWPSLTAVGIQSYAKRVRRVLT